VDELQRLKKTYKKVTKGLASGLLIANTQGA
jgi:hypothetical protein